MVWYLTIGTGENGSLVRKQFAEIINGHLVYVDGESVSTVYPGL